MVGCFSRIRRARAVLIGGRMMVRPMFKKCLSSAQSTLGVVWLVASSGCGTASDLTAKGSALSDEQCTYFEQGGKVRISNSCDLLLARDTILYGLLCPTDT